MKKIALSIICCLLAALAIPTSVFAAVSISYLSPDAVVTKGKSHTLKVEVSGFVAPVYQWYFNNKEIPGANGDTYTISSFAESNAGEYTVYIREGHKVPSTAEVDKGGGETPLDPKGHMNTDLYVRVKQDNQVRSDIIHLKYKSGGGGGGEIPKTGDDGMQIGLMLASLLVSATGFGICLYAYLRLASKRVRVGC